jgi:nitrogen-specific signal transduction histidine kinase/CheY-like chemotaxis protein
VRVAPLRGEGGVLLGTVGVAMDVSHEVRSAEQLRAAEHLASLGELAAGVAHEMNNVLAAILGMAQLLAYNRRVPTGRELGVIESAARRGAGITGALLGFARKGMYRRLPVDVSKVLDRLAVHVRETHPSVRIERVGEPDLPDVEGDPDQLEVALGNLVDNALAAMPAGGTLSIAASAEEHGERPELGLAPGPWVRVEVRDTGIGMTEEVRRRAIEPFFTTRAPGQGVGLGLSMAYGVIRNHGGQLHIDSEPGAGTTVTVYLPAAPAAVAVPTPPRAVAAPAARGGAVLVVDDDEWVRFSTRRLLERVGYEVIEATGGVEGLAAYRARGSEIVAVLLDLRMPGMDGAEALRRLVALDPDARVILSTGYERDQVSQGLFELGHVGFLGKPFGLAELEEQLRAFARAPRVPELAPT